MNREVGSKTFRIVWKNCRQPSEDDLRLAFPAWSDGQIAEVSMFLQDLIAEASRMQNEPLAIPLTGSKIEAYFLSMQTKLVELQNQLYALDFKAAFDQEPGSEWRFDLQQRKLIGSLFHKHISKMINQSWILQKSRVRVNEGYAPSEFIRSMIENNPAMVVGFLLEDLSACFSEAAGKLRSISRTTGPVPDEIGQFVIMNVANLFTKLTGKQPSSRPGGPFLVFAETVLQMLGEEEKDFNVSWIPNSMRRWHKPLKKPKKRKL